MKQIGPLLFIFAILTCTTLFADNLSVDFNNVHGTVFVRPDSQTDESYKPVKRKDRLSVGDRVLVKNDSGVVLNFSNRGTMVLKGESVAVLTQSIDNEIKYNLLSGDIWLSLKNISYNGFVGIEMSQSSVRINRGNITLSVSPDGLDNHIRVLNGEAEVKIKGRAGVSVLRAGQGMVLKQRLADAMRNIPAKGVVDVFDIQDEEERWESATSRIGSELSIDELTRKLNKYSDDIDNDGKVILQQYERIMAGSGTLSDVTSLKNKIAQFQAMLAEAAQYGRNGKLRIEAFEKESKAGSKKSDDSEDVELLDGYKKTSLQSALVRLETILSYFKNKLGKASTGVYEKSEPEKNIQKPIEAVEPLEQSLKDAYDISLEIRRAVLKGVNGKGRNWFTNARETLGRCHEALVKESAKIAEEQILYPRDKKLPDLAKKAEKYIEEVKKICKSFEVVEVPLDVLSYLRDLQDNIAANTGQIVAAIEEYRTTGTGSLAAKQKKRREYLKIVNTYSNVKRDYKRAERQCKRILRSVLPTMYKTEEIEEIEALWRDVEVDFVRLDEESGTLQQIMNE
ncbi:MAG: hypothetical protein GX031_00580 [Candidatus Riflebacteria bacterium]|nr:hypothetical protein [Candidatus Riflebacteria bacterium]